MMALSGRRALAWLLAIVALLVVAASASTLHALAKITTPVTDDAMVLSAAESEAIASRLLAHQRATGVQMAVVTIATTGSFPIEDYALRLAEEWGGGSDGRDDGVVYLLAIKDRKMRLEVGYGLEDRIPDGVARGFIDATRPLLRDERYADAILAVIDGVALQTRSITPATVLRRRARLAFDNPLLSTYALAWTSGALSAFIAATVATRRRRRRKADGDGLPLGALNGKSIGGELVIGAMAGAASAHFLASGDVGWLGYEVIAVLGALSVLIAVQIGRRERNGEGSVSGLNRFVAIGGCAILPWIAGAMPAWRGHRVTNDLLMVTLVHLSLNGALVALAWMFRAFSEIRLPRHGEAGWGTSTAPYFSSDSADAPFASSSFSSSTLSSSTFSSSASSGYSSSSASFRPSSSSASSSYGGGGGSFGGGGASSSW